jgi:glycosyltransferase involved in cell wall biosynthesis
MPGISAIITCYNLGRTVEQALNSVLAQTRPADEIVVVDDGSTDIFTRQVIERLGQGKAQIVQTPNRGVSAARNLGIRLTTSPYVALLDADDWFEPSYFEKAARRLDEDSRLDFVSCAQRGFGEHEFIWKPPPCNLVEHVTSGPYHISTMFRRGVWETVRGFREDLRADEEMDFWTSAIERGFYGEVLDEPLLNYRIRSSSMYHTMLRRENYLPLREKFYTRHRESLAPLAAELLLAKERLILAQRQHMSYLASQKAALESKLAGLRARAGALVETLAARDVPSIAWGDFDSVEPLSPYWGVERGYPVNRYYVEAFLRAHQSDIRGTVLEMKDPGYTRRIGGDQVVRSDVLDVDRSNPLATIVTDLAAADSVLSEIFDCFILTETLNFIFDTRSALFHSLRILKPGGVLLATVTALDRVSYETGPDADYWRFTEASLRRLLAEIVPLGSFEVKPFGNLKACTAYLHGLAWQECDRDDLDVLDPWFPVGFSVRVVKPIESNSPRQVSRPLVSIVTAFYNAEAFFEETIKSVLAQTYASWELLLIDDGSTDGSSALARSYADAHPGKILYIEYANHANRGAAASRNEGIRRAKGAYIAILDADDVWLPHKLERQVGILEAEPRAAMVCGRSLYWYGWSGSSDDLERDTAPTLGVEPWRLYEPPDLLNLLYPLGPGGAPCPSDILLRRSLMETDGGFQEDFRGEYQLYEDQVFLTKLYLKHPVFVSNDVWDKYRIHPQSCVSTVTAAGKYDLVRQHFLHWFAAHLSTQGMKGTSVWTALQRALAAYDPDRMKGIR